jgi:RimJ/RimL family protein N-acetyltransferase
LSCEEPCGSGVQTNRRVSGHGYEEQHDEQVQLREAVAAPGHEVFIAEEREVILGTYYLRINQQGGGAHVANGAYMVAPAATGRGIAQRMCEHLLEHARSRGFLALQFNFVVSTNERAVRLWERLGFAIVGRVRRSRRSTSRLRRDRRKTPAS